MYARYKINREEHPEEIMTITSATYTRDLDNLLALDEAVEAARQDMERAWKVQSLTTQEEGFDQEQANAAIEQAKAADRHYRTLYNLREARYVKFLMLDDDSLRDNEPGDIDVTPMSGW